MTIDHSDAREVLLLVKIKFRIDKNSLKSLRGRMYAKEHVHESPSVGIQGEKLTHVVMPSLADPSFILSVGVRGSAGGF
jgi:hypothetical protein